MLLGESRVSSRPPPPSQLLVFFRRVCHSRLSKPPRFAIDLLSIMPFDILGMELEDDVLRNLKTVRVLRLLRLVKA